MRTGNQHGTEAYGGTKWLDYAIFHFYLPVSTYLRNKQAIGPPKKAKPGLSMHFWIAIKCVIGRCVSRQAKVFACPGTKVDVFAAFAAKRAKRVAWRIDTGTTATRARDLPPRQRIFFHRESDIRVRIGDVTGFRLACFRYTASGQTRFPHCWPAGDRHGRAT